MKGINDWLNKATKPTTKENTYIPCVKIQNTVYPIESGNFTQKLYNDTEREKFFTNFNLPLIQQFRNFKNRQL